MKKPLPFPIQTCPLQVLDLFCGAGGLSYGFEMAGFHITMGIDNDIRALETFQNNHKTAKTSCKDITKLSYIKDIRPLLPHTQIDVIVGGPPCQGFSLSGPRNFNDPRNKLYLSYIRLVKEIRPRAFVIENVPGLVSLFGGQIKEQIVSSFKKLGYQVQLQILCAADYGIPQNRKRVFFVGLRKTEALFTFPNPSKNLVTSEMALSDLPPLINTLGNEIQNYTRPPQNQYQKKMRVNSNRIFNHVAAAHSEKVRHIISLVPDGGNYKQLPPQYQKSRNFHIAWTRFNSQKPAPTIDTGHRHHFHYKYNRTPTVRECARLQSFPDSFRFYGNKTQQFRQVGNAVPPLLAFQIAKQLKKSLLEKK